MHACPHNLSNTCTISRKYRHTSLHISTHTCFLSVSALTPCVFRVASLPPLSTANWSANIAAPPKDTIFAYWQATLLVTKGHTVKILNLWRIHALSAPKYAEKAQKRCCVLCVWLYLLPSSFKQWPKGHYFIGLRCWLPHNVQKSPLFQTNIKSGLRMQHYPQDMHTLTHTHTMCTAKTLCCVFLCSGCGCLRAAEPSSFRGERWPLHPVKGYDRLTEKLLCPPSMFRSIILTNLIKGVQGAIQHRHMLNVFAKYQWVVEEVGKDMKVNMHTSLCVCVSISYPVSKNPHPCTCMCDPVTCMPVWLCVCAYSICQFVWPLCMWSYSYQILLKAWFPWGNDRGHLIGEGWKQHLHPICHAHDIKVLARQKHVKEIYIAALTALQPRGHSPLPLPIIKATFIVCVNSIFPITNKKT